MFKSGLRRHVYGTQIALLCLCAVLKVSGETRVELRNDQVAFQFDAQAGLGLTGIRDLVTGRELVNSTTQAVPGATLWRLQLFQGAEMPLSVSNLSVSQTQHCLTRDGSRQMLVLTWNNIALGESRNALMVRVMVELEDGALLARWRLEAVAQPPWRVWGSTFPCVHGIRDLGDDYLAVPSYMGRIIHDPVKRLTPIRLNYPGKWSMQFVAAWGSEELTMPPPPPVSRGFRVHGWVRGPAKDEAGVFMMCEDPDGWHKTLALTSAGSEGYGWEVEHFPALPDWPAPVAADPVNYRVPYPVVLGVFNGTAESACDIYRGWALQQAWARRGPISRPVGPAWTHVPEYVRDTAFWGKFYYGPAKVAPELASYREYLRVPMMTHYYRYYVSQFDDNNPEYSPTDPYVRQGVRDMQTTGVRVMPYICGSVWDMDTESYRLQNGARGAVLGPGNEIESWLLAGNSPSAWMNPASSVWQEKLLDVGRKLTGDYGVDGLYFDVLPAASKLCYDPRINPPHGGKYWVQGNRKLLEQMRKDLCQRQPGIMFTGECFSENYIDLLDAFLTLDTTRYGWKLKSGLDVFPLASMVYHDYTLSFGSDCAPNQDIDNFTWQMGLNFIWGSQLMYSQISAVPAAGVNQAADAYLREAVRATHQTAKKFLTGGRWIQTALVPEERLAGAAPVAIISPAYRVSTKGTFLSGWPWIGPAVLGSTWRAPDTTVGFVLTNISSNRAPVTLRLDMARLAMAGVDSSSPQKRASTKLWRLWPLPAQAVTYETSSVVRLPMELGARSVIVLQLGGDASPVTRPLDAIAWRMAEAGKDGSFSNNFVEGDALWGCEDAVVSNEIVAAMSAKPKATLALMEESMEGVKPRHVATHVMWGAHEGHGKPRAPADKPFHVLQATPFQVSGDVAISAVVRFAQGVVWGDLRSGAPFRLKGLKDSTLLITDAADPSVARVYTSVVKLPAGVYRFVGMAPGVSGEATESWQRGKGGAVSFSDLAACTRIAVAKGGSTDGMSASLPAREQHMSLIELARGVTYLATGCRVWSVTAKDWLVPTAPLNVAFAVSGVQSQELSVSNARLACMDAGVAARMKIDVASNESGKQGVGFRVTSADPLLVEKLVPLCFRLDVRAGENIFAIGLPLWLNVDRPLMVKFDKLETLTTAGATSRADLRVRNVSPHEVECVLEAKLPEGWQLGPSTLRGFRLKPFTQQVVPITVKTAKSIGVENGVVEVAVIYAAHPEARVHGSFKVRLMPQNMETAGQGAAGWAGMRFRHRMVMLLSAVVGEKFELDLIAGAGNAPVRFELRSPGFKDLQGGTVPAKESRKITFTATESGTYLLEAASPDSWTINVHNAAGSAVLASEAVPLSLIHSNPLLQFAVKPRAKKFEIRVTDGGMFEPVAIRVFRPDGSEAWVRSGNWDDRWITVQVPPGMDGQMWKLKLDPREDVSVQLRGGVLPTLCQ